ncbi:MAG: hypothetical protein OEM61_08270 [Desulfobacteraceae bacterium]|nr:hypothetical protein [Desulfobacteraceae bacterium]
MSIIKNVLKCLPSIWVIVLIIAMTGCRTMGPATVELSTEITTRTKDIEKTHIYAVNSYFDTERKRIEEFMEEKWIPLFLRNMLAESQILKDLKKTDTIGKQTRDNLAIAAQEYLTDPEEGDKLADEIVNKLNEKRNNEDADIRAIVKRFIPDEKLDAATVHLEALLHMETPAVLIMEFAEAANEQIDEQKQALLKPIEDARLITVEELRKAYADIYAGQGIITGRLEASVRRGEQQARLVDAVGGEGTAASINAKLASFAEEVNDVFKKIDDLDKKIGMSEELSNNEAGDLANKLKQGLQKALVDAGLKEPKTKGGTEVEKKEGKINGQ